MTRDRQHEVAQSDAGLLAGSSDDPSTFDELFERNIDAVVRFHLRRTGCPHTAADLAAETFAEAFASRKRYAPTGAPAQAWLFTIARRQLSRYVRREQVATKYRRRLGISPTALDDAELERIESLADSGPDRAAIRDALDTLPSQRAEAVWLRIGQDLTYRQVAERLGCTEGAARIRVSRGLTQLADLMEAAP